MTHQNLEDLLHRRSFLFSDSVDIQTLVNTVVATLESEGRPFVIIRIYTNNQRWYWCRVTVPSANSGTKELVTQLGEKMDDFKVDFVFYYQDEVEAF